MRSRILVVAALIVLVMSFVSCSGSALMINIDVSCDQFEQRSPDLENEFDIEVGDKIKAKLCANPTTGYSWDYVLPDESVMKFESHEYMEPDTDLVGASGTDVWIFKAVKAGEVVIKMEYSRPWENGTETERTYTMDVTVLNR
jgi:inhibitor of cysteine peptidase